MQQRFHALRAGVAVVALTIAGTAVPAGARAPEEPASPTGSMPTTTSRPPWAAPDYSSVAPTGPYRTVAHGKSAGIRWKLLQAPGTLDTTCWRLTTTPKVKAGGANGPRGARCLPAVPRDADPVDVPQFVASSGAGSRTGYVVVRAPKGTRLLRYGTVGNRFHRFTGTTPFVIVDRAVPLWVDLRLPSGTELSCQAGAIMDRADLADPALWQASVGQAWFCEE